MHQQERIRGQIHDLADSARLLWLTSIRAACQTDDGQRQVLRNKEKKGNKAEMCCSCKGRGMSMFHMIVREPRQFGVTVVAAQQCGGSDNQ